MSSGATLVLPPGATPDQIAAAVDQALKAESAEQTRVTEETQEKEVLKDQEPDEDSDSYLLYGLGAAAFVGAAINIAESSGSSKPDEKAEPETDPTNDNAPVFTSLASASVQENQVAAYTAVARDADNNTLTYSLSGTDAALFDIDSTTGVVTFKTAPDFENPSDAGGDNVYDLTVSASDGVNSTDQNVAISVTDVIERAEVIDLTTLSAAQGFIIQGDTDFDRAGRSVSSAGDINGDGFDDLIISAPFGDDGGTNAGEAYVVFGSGSGFGESVTTDGVDRQVIDLTTLSATQGFIIQGDAAYDQAGRSVSSAGDINGDGFDDLIIGAIGGDDGGDRAGEAYVVFGSGSVFGESINSNGVDRQVIDLSTLSAAQGFIIQGDAADDYAGYSVSSAGDVNGDGFDDLIIGARYGDDGGIDDGGIDAGEAYVVFGSGSGFGESINSNGEDRQVIDLTTLSSTQGFIIQGDFKGDQAGRSVSSAGDINGDGFDDLIVGAPRGDDGGGDAGEAYVVFGSDSGFGESVNSNGVDRQVIDLSTLSAAQGFIIQRDVFFGQAGFSVSSAGDVNGDGFDDLIIGAPYGEDNGGRGSAGEAYVVFGSGSSFGESVTTDGADRQVIDLTTLSAAQGFIIQGDAAGDLAGGSVSSAGDINGDGFDDLIIGARFGDDGGNRAGEAYVVYGSGSGFGESITTDGVDRQVIDLTTLSATQGFIIQGDAEGDRAGLSVSSAGDINGDGFDDLIIGAPLGDDGGDRAGEAYVLYGGATGTESTVPVSASGTAAADNFTGNAGADSFSGISTGDVVRSGAGNDLISIDTLDFADLRGGTGFDALVIDADNQSIDLSDTSLKIDSFELIDLSAGQNNTLIVNELSIIGLTEERSSGEVTLRVNTNSTSRVEAIGFTANGSVTLDGISYERYSSAQVNLLVESGAQVDTTSVAPLERIDLATLTQAQGFAILGVDAYDVSGFSVSSAGDINGDGFDDVIIGAYRAAGTGNSKSFSGESYVVYGGQNLNSVDLATLTPAQGFTILGADAFDGSGLSVSSAGDVNGDGFDDLIIGAPSADGIDNSKDRSGESYVIYGGQNLSTVDLAELTQAQGFTVLGVDAYDQSGYSVSSAGDVNGDGFDDVIIGAFYGSGIDNAKDESGESYVIYGGRNSSIVDLADLTPAQGFTILGADADDQSGRSVSSAGDVNGDGFDDLIIGAFRADGTGNAKDRSGESYVIYGGQNLSNVDLATLTPAQGFTISGADANDYSGLSVSSAGDVNGDDFDDLIIGAPRAYGTDITQNASGESYVIYGGQNLSNVGLDTLTTDQGFTILGADLIDLSGTSVSSAGDINGDGFDDLIIGAYFADGTDNAKGSSGESYVIYGGQNLSNVDVATLTPAQGFTILGVDTDDRSGRSASSAGDVNGDGFDDLIVGSYGADGTANAKLSSGESYVIYGGATGTESTVALSFTGSAGADNFTGNAGSDSFSSISTDDVVRGGAGDDTIVVSSLDFANIDGGTGSDTLALSGSGLTLDLYEGGAGLSAAGSSVESIDLVDLTGTGDNTLSIDALGLFRVTEERDLGQAVLSVFGDSGDTVNLNGSFTDTGTNQTDGDTTYSLFANSDNTAVLRIDDDLSVIL